MVERDCSQHGIPPLDLPGGDSLDRLEGGLSWSTRAPPQSGPHRFPTGGEDEAEDPHAQLQLAAQMRFFQSSSEREKVRSARCAYPRRKQGEAVTVDPITGEENDNRQRRIQGFGLGFEKIFATTSIKLPVSAYTIFVELHARNNQEVFQRCFNGMHTIFDLKKWIYEKMLLPINSYALSYAEPGKAELTDQLRLLTTQESLDTRTLATTRAVHSMYKGTPGVHGISDIGVTRLYLRLKCRTCGDLLNKLQSCGRRQSFMAIEPKPDAYIQLGDESPMAQKQSGKVAGIMGKTKSNQEPLGMNAFKRGVPGHDPNIEDIWYRPDEKKHCLFHGRGFEMYEAARTHGGMAEIARIYISCGKEPSKKLKLGVTGPGASNHKTISY